MAGSHKFKLEFDELEAMLDDLEKAGGNIDEACEKALEESHAYITPLIEKKIDKSNMPAGGKYSSKERKHSLQQLIREPNITWVGKTCECDIGFNLDETIVPIFLIRGTPTMNAVSGLRSTLEGNKTKEKVAQIQHDVIVDEILKTFGM